MRIVSWTQVIKWKGGPVKGTRHGQKEQGGGKDVIQIDIGDLGADRWPPLPGTHQTESIGIVDHCQSKGCKQETSREY